MELELDIERSKKTLQAYLCKMKFILEKAITELKYTKYATDVLVEGPKDGSKFENGLRAKESLIRSQTLIIIYMIL